MKVALSFSGQPRFVRKCYNNIVDNIIIPNNIEAEDIYVHSWVPQECWPEYRICENEIGSNQDLLDIINLYSPSLSLFEKWIKFDEIVPKDNPYRQYNFPAQSMYYSIFKSISLVPLIKYDCIIRIRFDMNFGDKIFVKDFDLDKVHLQAGAGNRINDHFAFSNDWNMRGYSNTIGYLKRIFEETRVFSPEELLENTLKKLNLEICKHHWNNTIFRG